MDKTAIRLIGVFDTVDDLVFSLLMMSLPFGWQFSIIPLLLFAVLMFRKAIQERTRPSKEKRMYFLPVFAYFLVLMVSLIYSSNPGRGLDLILRKISLLIIPLLLLFTAFSRSLARKGFRFFILGTLLVTLFYFVFGLVSATKLGNGMLCIIPGFSGDTLGPLDTEVRNNYLMGDNLSFLMHPTYFGLLLALSIAGVVFTLIHEHKSILIQRIAVPVFVLESLALILLSTNGALTSAFLLAVLLIGMTIRYRHFLDLKNYWIVLVAMALLFGVAYNPQFRVLTGQTEGSANDMRKEAQHITWEVIKAQPVLGVGLGDLHAEMDKKYEEKGLILMKKLRINPHNQYLHTWAETGLAGLLVLIWMLASMVWYAIKRKNILMLAFAVFFAGSLFFESMLSRYWGIMTLAIFYTLFYFHSEPEEETEE